MTLNRKSQGQGHSERSQLRRSHQGLFPCKVSSLYWLMWPRTNLNAEVNQKLTDRQTDGQTDIINIALQSGQKRSGTDFPILRSSPKINILILQYTTFTLQYMTFTLSTSPYMYTSRQSPHSNHVGVAPHFRQHAPGPILRSSPKKHDIHNYANIQGQLLHL